MSSAKEVKQKIRSITNTRKITKAMEMVAVSKMRKAIEKMNAGKYYSERMLSVVNHLTKGNLEYLHPFLIPREVKKVGFVIASTDRGLCGGLNNNLFKEVVNKIAELDAKGIKYSFSTIGSKAGQFFKRFNADIIGCVSKLNDTPSLADVIGPVDVMLEGYLSGDIDVIYYASNKFVNTMTQDPQLKQIVPVEEQEEEYVKNHNWDYIYEPSAKKLLDGLLKRYIETQVYHGLIENLACEQAARMIAMKNASDNANSLIDELELIYNKARQAAITQELSEIVAGAAAV